MPGRIIILYTFFFQEKVVMIATAQAFMSVCESQTAESPSSSKMQPNLYSMGNYKVHACTYVTIVWLVIFVGTNLVKQAKIWVLERFSWF